MLAHQNHKTRLTGIEREYKRYKMYLFLAYFAKSATDEHNRINEFIIYPIQNRTIARLPPGLNRTIARLPPGFT